MTPYRGNEPFIFVSHAQTDSERVYPVIKRLMLAGFRVCYEEPPAEPAEDDFEDEDAGGLAALPPMELAERINNCSLFISMLSAAYYAEPDCREALIFVTEKHKEMLNIALDDGTYPPPASANIPTPDGRVLFRYQLSDTLFYEQLLQANLPEICKEPKGNPEIEEEYEAEQVIEQKAQKARIWTKILWGVLMALTALLIVLSANAEFRGQSVTIWSQILLTVLGFFGVTTAEPERSVRSGRTRFDTWAKWMTAVLAAIPLLLRAAAGSAAHQLIGGVIIAAILFGACIACYSFALNDAFVDPPIAGRAYALTWLVMTVLMAGWIGAQFRWAALIQFLGILGMAVFHHVTERSSGSKRERLANLLNMLLLGLSAFGILWTLLFFAPLADLIGKLSW